MGLFPAINEIDTSSYERQARRVNPNFFQTGQVPPLAGGNQLVQKYDAYAQHDRLLEHGYSGAQYNNGVLIGQIFNREF